ncbi:MAG: hypothetical protein ACTSR8_07170 [Promethearchaeota archaeon]
MKKLLCETCGRELEVPQCCDKSMIVREGYLICCCDDDCRHEPIPKCCEKIMKYCD